MDNYSLSDLASVVDGGKDGCFGNGMVWIVILFLFLFGMGGNGFGNRGNVAGTCETPVSVGQFESANNFRTIDNQLNGLANGLCDLGYTQANLINGATRDVLGSISNEGRALQMQLAECCCTTQRAIDSVKLENANNTQKILDTIQGNRMADMQNQINQLQLQSAMCGVIRFPNTWSWNAGVFPPVVSGGTTTTATT